MVDAEARLENANRPSDIPPSNRQRMDLFMLILREKIFEGKSLLRVHDFLKHQNDIAFVRADGCCVFATRRALLAYLRASRAFLTAFRYSATSSAASVLPGRSCFSSAISFSTRSSSRSSNSADSR